MFLMLTIASNFSPIAMLMSKKLDKLSNLNFKFKYQVITNITLALATISSVSLVIFFKYFFEIGSTDFPFVFLILLFILESGKSAYRVLIVSFIGHLKRQAVYAFIIGEGEYKVLLIESSVDEKVGCCFYFYSSRNGEIGCCGHFY